MRRARSARIVGCTLIALASACRDDSPPPAPIPVTFDNVCSAKYAPVKSEVKLVTLEGYLVPRETLSCSTLCGIDFAPQADSAAKSIGLSIPVGGGTNQMTPLPDGMSYRDKDIRVHAHDGRAGGVGTKLRVTGERRGTSYHGERRTCNVVATRIDLVE